VKKGPENAAQRQGIAWVVHTGSASLKNSIVRLPLRHFFFAVSQVLDLYGHLAIALLAGNLAKARFFKGWRPARTGYQQSYPQNF